MMGIGATRWAIAALVGSAMTAVGCVKPAAEALDRAPRGFVADDSLVHALDTSVEMRVIDRLELDRFLRERDIRINVIDGVVKVTGEVWTPFEKERVGNLVRDVAGMIDVANDLDVRPPR